MFNLSKVVLLGSDANTQSIFGSGLLMFYKIRFAYQTLVVPASHYNLSVVPFRNAIKLTLYIIRISCAAISLCHCLWIGVWFVVVPKVCQCSAAQWLFVVC